ncbi:MAG: hypothetical protein FJX67_11860 [Alphaproteobacteria bacterium]|nr:hypothetical protein [Alphaproteobacteria bacterium]
MAAAAARLDRLVEAAIAAGHRPPESPILSVRLNRPPERRQRVAAAAAVVREAGGTGRFERPPELPDGRIRLGYLSHDFFDHPIAHLAVGLVEDHARDRFAVTAFGYGPDDGSAWRRRPISTCRRPASRRARPRSRAIPARASPASRYARRRIRRAHRRLR